MFIKLCLEYCQPLMMMGYKRNMLNANKVIDVIIINMTQIVRHS